MKAYRVIGVVVAIVLAVVLVLAMASSFRAEPAPQRGGDMLGQVGGESFEEYASRAEASVASAPAEENVYGLVTFTEALEPAQAATVTEDLARVNAMVVGFAAPMPLPEPIEGESRADVYARELGRVENNLAGVGDVPVPEELTAVVAFDTGDAFRTLAQDPQVATVEVLPPDAAWGWFGISPVRVPGVEMFGVGAPNQ